MKENKEYYLTKKDVRYKTIVSILVFILFTEACIGVWQWINNGKKENNAPVALRKVLNVNEGLFGRLVDRNIPSKKYKPGKAEKNVRVNGNYGMSANFDAAGWKLQVLRKEGDTLFLTLDDIKKLPKTDVIFNFKCIEGWSQVTHWGGVRFSDFVKHYNLDMQAAMNYTGLQTPDKGYYVGIDKASMLHPQTILCYEMNGNPLPMNQGFPLRLIIPVKYGVKHLKRIGTIFFSNSRPADYWYEQGYDYFCGL